MVSEDKIFSSIKLEPLSKYVLNALSAHIAILSPEGKIVAYNKQWKDYGEKLVENWARPQLDENFLECLQLPLTSGNDFALRLLIGCKSVLSGEREHYEINYPVTHDGQKSWFKATLNRLEDGRGAVFINEDVSYQMHSRQFIRETQQKYQQYFNNRLFGILIADENNRIIEVNKEASSLFNIPGDKLLYKNISNFIDLDVGIHAIQRHINRNGNFFGEHEIITESGNKIPVEIHVTLFRNDKGAPVSSWAFKNISDKKRSDEARKISDQRYRLQFENSSEGIILAYPDGLMIEANPAACEMLGYRPEELAYKHRDLIFDSGNPQNANALKERQETGRFEGELVFTHKKGYSIDVELSTTIYELENGELHSIINFKDISNRKIIEQKLIQEQLFTESAISSMPTAFFVFDSIGNIKRWNAILEKDFGYTADEILSLNIMDVIHPKDRDKAQSYLSADHGGDPVSVEIRCITKSGKTLHYLITGKGFEENGEHYTVGGGLNLNNIKEIEREKKRNSELLGELFNNSPLGIVLIDKQERVINSNKAFERIFGYSGNELKGNPLNDFIVPDYMNSEAESMSECSFTGDSFQKEVLRKRKDGTEIPVLVSGVPVEVDDEIIAIYGLYMDLSERKKLENQIFDLLEGEKRARQQMEDMFDEAPSAIAMLEGENHTITYINKKAGVTFGSDLIGIDIVDALPKLAQKGLLDILNKVYEEGDTYHANEVEINLERDGYENPEKSYLTLVIKPLFDNKSDEPYGIFIDAIDVTEQVVSRRTIEKSLAEKETLLHEIHHRVKNNLAIVSGLIDLEAMDSTNEDVISHLNATQSRISTIAKIHETLYQNESLSHVSFSDYLKKILSGNNPAFQYSGTSFITRFDLEDVALNVNQAIPVGMLLNEVLSHLSEFYADGAATSDVTLFLQQYDDSIQVVLDDRSKQILSRFEQKNREEPSLRDELIKVLLKQIQAKMDIQLEENHTLTITFTKKEIKGAHSSLF